MPDIVTIDEIDRLFEDERANEIFFDVFNPEDESYVAERDAQRFRDCVSRIVVLGYSEGAAREFMSTNLSYCDD